MKSIQILNSKPVYW